MAAPSNKVDPSEIFKARPSLHLCFLIALSCIRFDVYKCTTVTNTSPPCCLHDAMPRQDTTLSTITHADVRRS